MLLELTDSHILSQQLGSNQVSFYMNLTEVPDPVRLLWCYYDGVQVFAQKRCHMRFSKYFKRWHGNQRIMTVMRST